MTTYEIGGMTAKLEEILHEEAGLVSRLYNCICAEERALIDDRLDAIRRSAESQEDLAAALARLEESRQTKVRELAGQLQIKSEAPLLHEIAERLPDGTQAQSLRTAGENLSAMMEKLRRKNRNVRGILNLRSEYTETLLKLIAGADDEPCRNYGARGQILNAADPGPGVYEVTI